MGQKEYFIRVMLHIQNLMDRSVYTLLDLPMNSDHIFSTHPHTI